MLFKKRIVFLILVTSGLVFNSCGAKKIIASGEASPRLSSKNIIKSHYENTLDFKTIRGRMKVDFDDGKTNQSFTLSLRMEKDKAIWVSATLSLVKALITPDRVTFYNKLDNTYFDGDFSYLSNIVGTPLDFQKVQNVLLGQAIFDLTSGQYDASVVNNTYRLEPEEQEALFQKIFFIEPGHFKIAQQKISQPQDNRELIIDYLDYQDIEKKVFPNTIQVDAIDDMKHTKITIEYKNITFDEKVSFPYAIPEGYEEIILE